MRNKTAPETGFACIMLLGTADTKEHARKIFIAIHYIFECEVSLTINRFAIFDRRATLVNTLATDGKRLSGEALLYEVVNIAKAGLLTESKATRSTRGPTSTAERGLVVVVEVASPPQYCG
jgi:hypothetical protein